jgi:hypothetical protein
MKPTYNHQTNFLIKGLIENDLFTQSHSDKFWDINSASKKEQNFNSLKYLLLTGVLVMLIAITVFISNRNQVSEQKELQSSPLISFFKK